MRHSPTLLLPNQVKMAPVPDGNPSKEFFAAGSSFAHGDQASHLWKSVGLLNGGVKNFQTGCTHCILSFFSMRFGCSRRGHHGTAAFITPARESAGFTI
jgi:hypothetical protein